MQDKYYQEIKEKLEDVEIVEKVKNYTVNSVKLEKYYEIGRLIIEAQGGEEKARYGEKLIEEYSKRLTIDLGKGYSMRMLKKMRKFYLIFQKGPTLSAKLNWSHYEELLKYDDINEINYYIDLIIKQNLSVRELRTRIKNKEYESLDDNTKIKLINSENTTLIEKVPNPIVIDNPNKLEIKKEKVLHAMIMEQLPKFLKRLGEGYTYVGDEYPIKIGLKNNYIDFLLYNYKYKCFVVVELKMGVLKKEHICQTQTYMNYIDNEIKNITDFKTIGIILGYKDNDYIMKYCSDDRVIFREYVVS